MVCLLTGFHVVVLLPLISDFGSNSNVSCSRLDSSDKTSRRFRLFNIIYTKLTRSNLSSKAMIVLNYPWEDEHDLSRFHD